MTYSTEDLFPNYIKEYKIDNRLEQIFDQRGYMDNRNAKRKLNIICYLGNVN